MMSRSLLVLLLLASSIAHVVALQRELVVDATSMVRGGSISGEADMHGRRMSSTFNWSWANLLCKLLAMYENTFELY